MHRTVVRGGSGIILAHLGRRVASPLKMGVKKLWSVGGCGRTPLLKSKISIALLATWLSVI